MNPILNAERNRILLVDPETGKRGNFTLAEFQNKNGLVIVQASTLWCLERIHARGREVVAPNRFSVVITDGIRTDEDNAALAAVEGWIGELAPNGQPGEVSRTSHHLVSQGASGVDFRAFVREGQTRQPFPMERLAAFARAVFDYVKVYADHIHGDNRDGCTAYARAGGA